MFNIIADIEALKNNVSIDIKLEAATKEELLVSWLDELLYSFYTKGMIFSEFEMLDVTDKTLSAKVHGRPIGDNRSRLKTEIKAATFHDLRIQEKNGVLFVEIVFDV
jgi:SHS2 domain-containing protein